MLFPPNLRPGLRPILPLFLLLSLLTAACAPAEPLSDTGLYFDTVITVTLCDSGDPSLLDDCFALAEKYEKLLSATIEGSDVWNINHAQGRQTEISPETALLLESALSYARLTGGAVDPTIGPLSSLWNFSSGNTQTGESRIPSAEEISALLPHVDYRSIRLDDTQVTLTDPLARIDLGFIAKGYIADRMKEYLLSRGVKSAIIDLGGNVLTIGTKADGSPFNIGLQKPFAGRGTPAATISVQDKSVVSSGIYERCFEEAGQLYHHILDTKTGYPVRNSLLQVTILSDSSMDGDALSTSCLALGLEKGMALIEKTPEAEAIFITDDGQLHPTSGVSGLKKLP